MAYPLTFDTLNDGYVDDIHSLILPEDMNAQASAIMAVQQELGLSPSGAAATVAERLGAWQLVRHLIPSTMTSASLSGDLPNGVVATTSASLAMTIDAAELALVDGTMPEFKMMCRAIAADSDEMNDLIAKVSLREITAYGWSTSSNPIYTISATPLGEITFTNPKRTVLQQAQSAVFQLDVAKKYLLNINLSTAIIGVATLGITGSLLRR